MEELQADFEVHKLHPNFPQTMSEPQTEFDSPWKDVIERYFQDFILFFCPQAFGEIEWSRGFEFLDKELQQVVRDAEFGLRLVDKLAKIFRTDGDEAWVLIHIEVQSQEETNFAQRMFVYYYRIYDRYKRSVASIAVLGDERSSWRPNQFRDELWGCEVLFKFPVVKLLDYQQQWSALEVSSNPFAIVVMAHLKAQETRDDRSRRLEWKLAITRRLYERRFSREDVLNLFGFLDWVMSLPEELEQQFWREVIQYEEERRMPYIMSIERIATEKGLQQGLQQGIEQSREQMRQVLLESLELALELKFGGEGLRIFPEISQIQEVEQLRAIQARLRTVNTLSELRQVYQH